MNGISCNDSNKKSIFIFYQWPEMFAVTEAMTALWNETTLPTLLSN